MGWGKEFQLTLILAFSMAGCRWAIQKFGPILLKEVSIALFYLVGTIWLPLLRVKAVDLSWEVLIFAVLFFVVALLNLWMLSLLDREEDRHDGFVSLAHVYPPQQLIQWIQRLSFVGIFTSLAAFILLPSFYRPFSCILLLMFLVHYLTFFQSQLPVTQKRQRMELAFLDSVVAPLDLGMRGIPCLRVKANEQSQPNRSTQAEAEWQTQNHYRSKDA